MKLTLFIIILLFFILYILNTYFNINKFNATEQYTNNPDYDFDIKAYVITLGKPERIKNIEENKNKIKLNIEIIDAVYGDSLNFENLIDEGKLSKDFYQDTFFDQKIKKRQIGCYLSHLKTYEKILNDNNNGYSILFEDDFKVVDENFIKIINNAIKVLQNHDDNFDFLFLGNTFNNKDINISDNIYTASKNEWLYGCHAMLINNKKMKNIYDKLKFIDGQIDVNISKLNFDNKLNIYTLYPIIVDQAGLESSIII